MSVRYLLIGLAFICCVFAAWKGGSAERGGAALIAANWLIITITQVFFHEHNLKSSQVVIPSIVCDLLLAAGFLWLALRYSSLWLGAAMILQGVQLAIYGSFLSGGARGVYGYAVAINITSSLVLWSIIGGTAMSWRARARAAPAAAS